MANQEIPEWVGTYEEMYSKADLAWKNCLDNLPDFFDKKKKYIVGLITTQRDAIKAARLIPDQEARELPSITFRAELIALLDTCLGNLQDLKSYIDDVKIYPHDSINGHYAAAGANYYDSAQHFNWEDAIAMNNAMINFIEAEKTNLLADLNMNPGFQAKVSADALAFETKYNQFLPARETGVATNAKVHATNLINKDYKALLKDGKNVYRKNKTKRDLFTDENLIAIVSPPGSASLEIDATNGDFNAAAGATFVLSRAQHPDIPLTLGPDGKVKQSNMDVDRYTYVGKLPLHKDVTGTKDVDKGTNARLVVHFEKL